MVIDRNMMEADPRFDAFCNEVLSLIEIEEAKSLAWGFINLTVRLDEVLPSIIMNLDARLAADWSALQEAGVTIDDVIRNLTQRKLVFSRKGKFRTRFAETIRNLFLLRQLFPGKDWKRAKTLVSDVRLVLAKRRFPKREISVGLLLKVLTRSGVGITERELVKVLLTENGRELALANFQVDSITRVFEFLGQRDDRAIVIGAGTGAGKTKAFYVPALAALAATVIEDKHPARIMGIYPRNELLRDQFTEAMAELDKLAGMTPRQLSIGAYFGDTPEKAEGVTQRYTRWKEFTFKDGSVGYVCPYLRCPQPDCDDGKMIWRQDSLNMEVEANRQGKAGTHTDLVCSSCGYEVKAGTVLVSRHELRTNPPDILFTTTEMLNRSLARPMDFPLIGLSDEKAPRLLLLDEIHSYEGTHGAHVAYLLRRWRANLDRAEKKNLCVVGLSATLTDARRFVSDLTGVPTYHSYYSSPSDGDLADEGLEYNIVVRGDAASATSLLSTSIQTVMLISRSLDPMPSSPNANTSRGAIGWKTFAFTDKLDVINRWYSDERDAETYQMLARLRKVTPDIDDKEERLRAGQDWWMAEDIGHLLEAPLSIDLVSSQSRGLNKDAQLVIASSSLELGFNDLGVGAVVQHKAPRSYASFIQRKGRAGRTRPMRPWTVLVTSAFGRDSWAFQHAERYFQPSIPPIRLPMNNLFILKIQGAYELADWLAQEFNSHGIDSDVRQLLTKPRNGKPKATAALRLAVKCLGEILDGSKRGALTRYIAQSLEIEPDSYEMQSILWEPPRPLILDVVPTVLRQLEGQWRAVRNGQVEQLGDSAAGKFMPKFVPQMLFGDLNIPELEIELPGEGRRPDSDGDEGNLLPLSQGLVEFAPGKVNKRYGAGRRQREAHWLAVPFNDAGVLEPIDLDLLDVSFDELPITVDHDGTTMAVFRPYRYRLAKKPKEINISSNARLQWQSAFRPRPSAARDLAAPLEYPEISFTPVSPVRTLVKSMSTFLHARGDGIEVVRFAPQVKIDLAFERRSRIISNANLVRNAAPAALGFEMSVDAIRIDARALDIGRLKSSVRWPALLSELRPHYFRHLLDSNLDLLEREISVFDIDWIWQTSMAMLTATAIATNSTLDLAQKLVDQGREEFAQRVLRTILEGSASLDESGGDPQAVLGRLMARFSDDVVLGAVRSAEKALWSAPDEQFDEWLQEVYSSSLSASIYSAILELLPEIGEDELVADVENGRIWLTETSPGGVGAISRIDEVLSLNPREFDLQLADTIAHCERQLMGESLEKVAEAILESSSGIASSLDKARAQTDLPTFDETKSLLLKSLESIGIPPTREIVVAINSKMLRPNSGADTDRLLGLVVKEWKTASERLGIGIDARVMAVAGYQIPTIKEAADGVIRRLSGQSDVDEAKAFNLIQSLLWLSCRNSCPECIQGYQPYQTLENPSRLLLQLILAESKTPINYEDSGWQDELRTTLAENFHAEVLCPSQLIAECKQQLMDLVATPFEFGYQMFFPVIDQIDTREGLVVVGVSIRELLYRQLKWYTE